MRTKRSKRWDNGVKARLLAQLMYYDQDFKFEVACRGVPETIQKYTQRELKAWLARCKPQSIPSSLSFTQMILNQMARQLADQIDKEVVERFQ